MFTSSHPQRTDFISETEACTLPGLFQTRVGRSPNLIAYQQYDEKVQAWCNVTWRELQGRVSRWRQALQREQLQPGERVAIMLKNSVEWVCFDQAAQSLGLVIVAMYPTDTPEDIAYILTDADVRLLLLSDTQQWRNLASHCSNASALKRVWYLQQASDISAKQDEFLCCVADILPHETLSYSNKVTDPDQLATLIYTSGTTGRPKGVMLTHHNILANAAAVQNLIPAFVDDVFLSFLPLAHAFERTVEYYLPMMAGSRVSYTRSIELLAEDLLIIRPTVFLSAPRLYEKIYSAIQNKIASHYLKRKLFAWTMHIGLQHFEATQKRRPPLNPVQTLLWKILHKMVAEKILVRFGGRVRVAVTGAAPLSPRIARFFLGLDLPLLEGYGLTEAGPVVSGNRPDLNVPGSVGVALQGVEVMTAENGELLIRSPGVMQGYWKREQDSQNVIDSEGWLHSGDLAEIKEGAIFIRGRLKEILVTSTGEKVAPADLETTITLDPLFEQAMVVGEGRPYIAALLVLNPEAWAKLATALGLDPTEEQSLHSPEAMKAVLEKLADLLGTFPVYAQIHAVHLGCKPWRIENGLLTPTLKTKRDVLEKRFEREISALYRGHAMVD